MTRAYPAFGKMVVVLAAIGAALAPAVAGAEEIWLYNNTREYGLVQGVAPGGKELVVLMPTGEEKKIKLQEIIAIRFLGRNPLLVQSGTQEFRFVNGGTIRGQILENVGNLIRTRTATADTITIDFARLRGFVALPLAGFIGRKAEELVDSPYDKRHSKYLDTVLDHRGSIYRGVMRKLEETHFHLYHEETVKVVRLREHYVKGVRLADAARDRYKAWDGRVQMRIWSRDGSIVEGQLSGIRLGKWCVTPVWNPKKTLQLDLDEISLVQMMGGRVQYLSQLIPVQVKEQTILAPPQPYRMDRSCQGDAISIAGKRYPWGIGVHADSELTFDLKGRFQVFRADVGIATRMGKRGSVIFSVLGDGKERFNSGIVRGSDPAPKPINIRVDRVKRLTLKVVSAGDLDLGDAANWGSARALRKEAR